MMKKKKWPEGNDAKRRSGWRGAPDTECELIAYICVSICHIYMLSLIHI